MDEPAFSETSQYKEEGFLWKLPRSKRRIARLHSAKLRWREKFFIARREWLLWASVKKTERYSTRQIRLPHQSEPSVVFLHKALKQVLFLAVHNAHNSVDKLEIAFQSRWAWHFWHKVFAHSAFDDRRGIFVSYRINQGRWRRRYMRIANESLMFIKLKLPIKVWPLIHTQMELLPDGIVVELRRMDQEQYLYLRHESTERLKVWHTYITNQLQHISNFGESHPLLLRYLDNPNHPLQLPIYILGVLRDIEENAKAVVRQPMLKPLPSANTFNILTIDGGGLRGLISAIILERLADRFPHLLDSFAMIAGTSSGSILAASIAMDFPPSALRAALEVHC